MNTQGSPKNILRLAIEADAAWFRDELSVAWRSAQDRADQAQDALAAHR